MPAAVRATTSRQSPLARCAAAARPAPIGSFAAIPNGDCCNLSGLKLEIGIPSPDTSCRLLGILDLMLSDSGVEFRPRFEFATGGGGGAYARRTGKPGAVLMTDRAAPGAPLHLVSARAEEQRPAPGPAAF